MNIETTKLGPQPVNLRGIDAQTSSVEQEWFVGGGCRQAHGDGDMSPFVRAVLAMVRPFVQSVDNADFRVREHFQQAMWTLGQLGVSEQELSLLLSTTPNAINRWMNGRSAPTPVVRSIVIRAGLDILRRDGIKIAGQYFDAVTGRAMQSSR